MKKLKQKEAYEIMLEASDHFGLGHQTMKLCEEMAECTAAILKGVDGEHMIEEIFDVYIVLMQVMSIMNLDVDDPIFLKKILKLKGIIRDDKNKKQKTIVKNKVIKTRSRKIRSNLM